MAYGNFYHEPRKVDTEHMYEDGYELTGHMTKGNEIDENPPIKETANENN